MKILVITVAGLSSRFSQSVGYKCLKCIYYTSSVSQSILYRMLSRERFFDKIVIVGGYKFNELKDYLNTYFNSLNDKLVLVENKEYDSYGSGYSLYLGLQAIKGQNCSEVVFAEGDLIVDDKSFEEVCAASKSLITLNSLPIYADKSVALYFDVHKVPHYIYDVCHGALMINEPFISIFNSAQIWKFTQIDILESIIDNLNDAEKASTNLVIINKYFQSIDSGDIDIVQFSQWINCNTVEDFNKGVS